MGLKKAENQVKILLADTIMALCRNTLNQHAEISVEGLLGITLDNDEIFLVSLNQTIKNPNVAAKKRSIEQDNNVDRKDSKKSRKDSDNDQDSDSESEKKPRRRKRHKKRRSRSSAGESESSSEGEGSDTTIEENSYNAAANSTDLTDVTNSQNVVRIKREQDEDEDEDLVIVKEELSENIPSSSAFPFMAQSFQGIPQLHGTSLNNFQPNSSMNESISSHNPPMHISPHPQPGTSVSQSGYGNCYGDDFGGQNCVNLDIATYSAEENKSLIDRSVRGKCDVQPQSNGSLNYGKSDTSMAEDNKDLIHQSLGIIYEMEQNNANISNSSLADNSNSTCHSTEGGSTVTATPTSMVVKTEGGSTSQKTVVLPPGAKTCHLCLKGFKSSVDLRRHMVVHTQVKLFRCIVCQGKFSTKGSLKRHIIGRHGEKCLATAMFDYKE